MFISSVQHNICMYYKMITTVCPVNIYHHTQLNKIFFLIMNTFKINSPSYLKICNTVLLTPIAAVTVNAVVGFMTRWCPRLSCLLQCRPALIDEVCRSQSASFQVFFQRKLFRLQLWIWCVSWRRRLQDPHITILSQNPLQF